MNNKWKPILLVLIIIFFISLYSCPPPELTPNPTPTSGIEETPSPTTGPDGFIMQYIDTNGLILNEYTEYVTVYGYNGSNPIVVIPDTYVGKPITKIDDFAFYKKSHLTNITLPLGLKSIANSAFNGCSGFTCSLTLPAGLISIGEHAFSGCSGFTGALTLPAGLTSNRTNESLQIQVPPQSVEIYKTANGWSNYADIISAIP